MASAKRAFAQAFDPAACFGADDAALIVARAPEPAPMVVVTEEPVVPDVPRVPRVPKINVSLGSDEPDEDADALVQDLGLSYSPVHPAWIDDDDADDDADTETGYRTPDPLDILDDETRLISSLLDGSPCDVDEPMPLAMRASPGLNRSHQHGCFATAAVDRNPPLIDPSSSGSHGALALQPPEPKEARHVRPGVPPYWDVFHSSAAGAVEGKGAWFAGALSDAGGVHAWMLGSSKVYSCD